VGMLTRVASAGIAAVGGGCTAVEGASCGGSWAEHELSRRRRTMTGETNLGGRTSRDTGALHAERCLDLQGQRCTEYRALAFMDRKNG